MSHSLIDLYRQVASTGPAIVPPGPGILRLLDWDTYRNWEEIDPSHKYVFQIEVALLSLDGTDARIRQTIKLSGHAIVRKHEVAFAFSLVDVADIGTVDYPGSHPGRWSVPIKGLYRGYDPAYVSSPGTPTGLRFDFHRPIMVRRWSCLPITQEVLEQEMSVFAITVWFATEKDAEESCRVFKKLIEERSQADDSSSFGASSGGPSSTPVPPRFEEFPAIPPGGIPHF